MSRHNADSKFSLFCIISKLCCTYCDVNTVTNWCSFSPLLWVKFGVGKLLTRLNKTLNKTPKQDLYLCKGGKKWSYACAKLCSNKNCTSKKRTHVFSLLAPVWHIFCTFNFFKTWKIVEYSAPNIWFQTLFSIDILFAVNSVLYWLNAILDECIFPSFNWCRFHWYILWCTYIRWFVSIICYLNNCSL